MAFRTYQIFLVVLCVLCVLCVLIVLCRGGSCRRGPCACPCFPCGACATSCACVRLTWIVTSSSFRCGSDYRSVYLVTRQRKYIEDFVDLKQNIELIVLTYRPCASSSSYARSPPAATPPSGPSASPKYPNPYLRLVKPRVVVILVHQCQTIIN